MNLNRQTLLPLANFGDIRYINARRVSPSNGEMRLCVYNATHLASAMEINKFISAALGLVRFFIPGFRGKRDASNINRSQIVTSRRLYG